MSGPLIEAAQFIATDQLPPPASYPLAGVIFGLITWYARKQQQKDKNSSFAQWQRQRSRKSTK